MVILFLLLMIQVANADVFVVTAGDKSVYSISEQDDAVVPDGYKKAVLKGKKIVDLGLDEPQAMYDFSGSKFSLNAKKVTDRSDTEKEAIINAKKYEDARASVTEKLKGMSLTADEIDVILKK